MWQKLSITLRVRLISNFFQELITMAFLPFIALYLSDLANPKFAGIFLTLLVIANFPVSIVGGHLIETFPKKKAVLLYQSIMGTMLLFMALIMTNTHQSIALFCICYAIYNIVWGLQYPAMDTIIMDAITPDNENFIYKIDYWLTNVATAFGALIGGLLYHNYKATLLFLAFFIFFAVFGALWKWLPKDDRRFSKNITTIHPIRIIKSYESVLKDRRFILMTLGFSILMMGELSASSYIAIRLKESFNPIHIAQLNIDGVKMYSILMIVNTVIVISCTYIISKWTIPYNQKYILLYGMIMYVVGYANVTYLNHFYLLIVFMIVATIGEIIYVPIFDVNRFKMIPEDKRGTYSAFNSLGFNLSELMARFGILLGVFLTSWGMAVYMLIILSIGAYCIYKAIYGRFQQRSV
ncbi:MDR family MFS transporter [Staphylococcus intermedius]|uniref:Major facilitator family transporter n=1 Tax=Staphylococcus intermedius NCTC 11048 TaxID=1141106 RepID=A0A380G2V6_STAIN|nr:MFS transporter [Staphylococcus intermedius]PCF64327.1 MFS transporter [Staphylococcus intermedius]PCF79042.1 MFS transporter [Staphylococcus intermedius]PCF80015.1 MFS transporter [Staphylococcus intermedius]PCF89325.1 MFS transporter [Staphylococcus intermedius]PNZ50333.1 MFS transporter [Staphylococcus intermedius NCTC 11048]